MCHGSSALDDVLIKLSLCCLHLGFHRDGMHGHATGNMAWDVKNGIGKPQLKERMPAIEKLGWPKID